uniref:Uncharacterized protein n=1 Tax=Cacopsylla melanoneura TaxID=428564 RepID=A0A8D9BP02_9HEMI
MRKQKVSAAQQTTDRSESETESSLQTDENESRQSVNFTQCYDPCAGRDRLLDTIAQMNDPNYEDLCSVDENATEDGTADETDEMRRIQCGERPVRDICEKYRREFNEKNVNKGEKDTNEDNTGEVEQVNSQTETATDIDAGDKENEEKTTANTKDGVIEATDENANDNEIEKETAETKDDALDKEKQKEDKEQQEETKTDENVEVSEPVVNEPTEHNTHDQLVKDITADIEAQLDTLLENLETKISDQTTNVLSKYIINTSRGSIVYHMSCSSVEHMVKFIKEIHPQFNLDRCQSLPSIDTSQVIDAPLSSSIRTTLAFPSQSWGTFCSHACPRRTTSFSSDAISLYLQQLDISEPQLISEANNPTTPVNSNCILGDIESDIIRQCMEESTEIFAQDLNGCSSSEVLARTKTVTFTPDI